MPKIDHLASKQLALGRLWFQAILLQPSENCLEFFKMHLKELGKYDNVIKVYKALLTVKLAHTPLHYTLEGAL